MALYSDKQRQQVEDWFAHKQTGTLSDGLTDKLASKLKIPRLYIDAIVNDLLKDGQLSSISGRYLGKLTCHIPPPVSDSKQSWSRVLERAPGYPELLPCHPVLAEWRTSDMEKLLECLLDLKAALPDAYQLSKYEASARYLLGSAKLLDSLDNKSLKQFGIDRDCFQQSISYVVIAGPENPEQILLIENPQSFEACIRANLHKRWGLINTYGYGLKWKELMEQSEKVVSLVRAGSPEQTFQQLLDHPAIFFWGDLDYEGLNIYRSIVRYIPDCQLSNLYLPMVAQLHNGYGHPYAKATEKQSQRRLDGLPILAAAVDQERFNDASTLATYGSGGMSLASLSSRLPGGS